MAHAATAWVSGSAPDIDENTMDNLELQYDEAVAEVAVLIAAIPEDAAVDVASQRTLGAGALQAAAGNHTH